MMRRVAVFIVVVMVAGCQRASDRPSRGLLNGSTLAVYTLADAIGADSTTLPIDDTRPLRAGDGGFFPATGEFVIIVEVRPSALIVARGQRDTKVQAHRRGEILVAGPAVAFQTQ